MEAFGDCIDVKKKFTASVGWKNAIWAALSTGRNPAGEEDARREVAVIKDGVDAGGSYVFVQRWEHNLKQLNRMNIHDQEMMIGRTKEANEEIERRCARPATSHLSRVDLKEDGKRAEDCAPEGHTAPPVVLMVYFCALTAHAAQYRTAASGMFGDTDGKRDAMLRFWKNR